MRPGAVMDNFAFMIHPLDPKRDVARKYPLLARLLPTPLIHLFSVFWPPVYLSRVTGVRSEATGKEIEGWVIACPLTAQQALCLPPRIVYSKVVQTGRLAQRLGARLLGLGAFTSVVGDGGVTVARRLGMPVTTGRSLTVAIAVAGLQEAARSRGVELCSATTAVVGATGTIGSACAELLAPLVGELLLVSRLEARLIEEQGRIQAAGASRVRVSTDVSDIHGADLVLSATGAARPVIGPEHLKRGAIVCDVAQPPDVSPRVIRERSDVLVFEGGIVDMPGVADLGFDLALPPGKTYACMAEAMVLALEGRYESYSLGKRVETVQVREMARLAQRHGFRPTLGV